MHSCFYIKTSFHHVTPIERNTQACRLTSHKHFVCMHVYHGAAHTIWVCMAVCMHRKHTCLSSPISSLFLVPGELLGLFEQVLLDDHVFVGLGVVALQVQHQTLPLLDGGLQYRERRKRREEEGTHPDRQTDID